MKILLVDDNPSILEALELILATENYETIGNTDGDATHQLALSLQPDLIILDLLLTGKHGNEIAKELKADPQTNHIPIIMISAHPTAKKIAEEAGANAFLAKPFDVEQMLTTVQHLLP